MIKGLINEQVLKLRLKTGFSNAVVIWAYVALVAMHVALLFFLAAAFVWLMQRYDAVTAALILGGVFLALTIIALLALVLTRGRNIDRARAELTLSTAARQHAAVSWMDPKMLAIGVQLLSAIGMKRVVPIAAAGFLAATLGKEWARKHAQGKSADKAEV